MQVVYSPRHLAHDITPRRSWASPIPANEVAERAESGSGPPSRPTAGSRSSSPTEHGEAPITAVHDEGLVRFLEVAWSEVRAQAHPARLPVGRHVPEPSRCSRACRRAPSRRLVREPRPRRRPGRVLGSRLGGAARRRHVRRGPRARSTSR